MHFLTFILIFELNINPQKPYAMKRIIYFSLVLCFGLFLVNCSQDSILDSEPQRLLKQEPLMMDGIGIAVTQNVIF